MTARLTLLAVIGALLAVPASVSAGGWATVGLEPPVGVAAGEPWQAEMTILQHGVTPLEDVRPRVMVWMQGESESEQRIFPAMPTGKPGVYLADVTFDRPGTWNYRVDDGFTAVHDFKPVTIGKDGGKDPSAGPLEVASTAGATPPSAGDGGGPDSLLAILAAAVAALAAGCAAALLQRRRGGPGPAAG